MKHTAKEKLVLILFAVTLTLVTALVAYAQAALRTSGSHIAVTKTVGDTVTAEAALTTPIGAATSIYVTATVDPAYLKPIGPTQIVWTGTPKASLNGDSLGSFTFTAIAPGTTRITVTSTAYDDKGNPMTDTVTSLDTLVISPLAPPPPAPAIGVGLFLQP